MWPRRRDPYVVDPYEEVLVEECESFLAGGYVERCEACGEPVPVWAWMNVLAHGTDAELRAAAANRSEGDEGHQALAFVAGELVDLIDDGCVDLEELQRDVLMPLELDVIACPAATRWSAAELVSALLRVLPVRSSHGR